MDVLGVRRFLPVALLLIGALALPSAADAVLGGTNGRILFTSGRDSADGDDSTAKLFLRTTVGSLAAGEVGPTITGTPGVQHRHATWAPDRTKIVYARGTPGTIFTENYDIYILDLTVPGAIPMAITNTGDGVTSDRPAWSPDGTRIVFDNERGSNAGQRDLAMYDVASGNTTMFTDTATTVESDPAWTPDSSEVYYQTGDPNGTNTLDIVKKSVATGTVTSTIANNPLISEFQPSVSPDGKNICFTRGTGFNNTTDIVTSLANGGGQAVLSDNAATGDINCTWSPNGTQVLYTRGIFSSGELVMEKADNSEIVPTQITDDPGNFDGNADWAPDGSPVCDDVSASTGFDQPVELTLTCRDTGPEYEKTDVQSTISEQPANGTLTPIIQGDPGTTRTSTVTYTPNPGFTGTDTFEFNSFDFRGFGQVRATATIEVKPRVTTPPPPPPPPPPTDTTAPRVTGITMKPKSWRLTKRPKNSKMPVGTAIGFKLTEAADLTLRFQKIQKGRKVRKKCVAPTRARRKKPRCKRFLNAGKKTLAGRKTGADSIRFKGRLDRGRLRPGKYRMLVSAVDPSGNASAPRRGPRFFIARR